MRPVPAVATVPPANETALVGPRGSLGGGAGGVAELGEIANGGVSMNRSSASIQRREETRAGVSESRRGLANRVRQSNDAHVTRGGGPRGRFGAPRVPGRADG